MNATNQEGHIWQDEQSEGWFLYRDSDGNLYESKEKPAYRIVMDNAFMGPMGITPINPK